MADEAQLDDVAAARPEITKAVESMLSKGKWTVPGYVESACSPVSNERPLTCLRRVRSASPPPPHLVPY